MGRGRGSDLLGGEALGFVEQACTVCMVPGVQQGGCANGVRMMVGREPGPGCDEEAEEAESLSTKEQRGAHQPSMTGSRPWVK